MLVIVSKWDVISENLTYSVSEMETVYSFESVTTTIYTMWYHNLEDRN